MSSKTCGISMNSASLRLVLCAAALTSVPRSWAIDVSQGARALGYADFVARDRRCGASITAMAESLRADVGAYYHFSGEDIAGTTPVGAEVRKGRAEAKDGALHPEYKGQFCDSMEEVIAVWRSQVLPSP